MMQMTLRQSAMKFCILRNLVIVRTALNGKKKGQKRNFRTMHVNIRV